MPSSVSGGMGGIEGKIKAAMAGQLHRRELAHADSDSHVATDPVEVHQHVLKEVCATRASTLMALFSRAVRQVDHHKCKCLISLGA